MKPIPAAAAAILVALVLAAFAGKGCAKAPLPPTPVRTEAPVDIRATAREAAAALKLIRSKLEYTSSCGSVRLEGLELTPLPDMPWNVDRHGYLCTYREYRRCQGDTRKFQATGIVDMRARKVVLVTLSFELPPSTDV